jgi:hypothetical protein
VDKDILRLNLLQILEAAAVVETELAQKRLRVLRALL